MRVLIFGASGGLGQALVRWNEQKGHEVFAVTRSHCDLSVPAEVERFARDIIQKRVHYDLCVFASGYSEAGYLDKLPASAIRTCMEVNFHAPSTLFLNLVQADLCRNFVFVLSGVGELLFPGLSPYGLAKRALRDFLYFWKVDNPRSAVYTLSVWPGKIDTPFTARTKVHGEFRFPGSPQGGRAPEYVADKIMIAAQKRKRRLVLSWLPNLAGKFQALFPCLTQMLLRRK